MLNINQSTALLFTGSLLITSLAFAPSRKELDSRINATARLVQSGRHFEADSLKPQNLFDSDRETSVYFEKDSPDDYLWIELALSHFPPRPALRKDIAASEHKGNWTKRVSEYENYDWKTTFRKPVSLEIIPGACTRPCNSVQWNEYSRPKLIRLTFYERLANDPDQDFGYPQTEQIAKPVMVELNDKWQPQTIDLNLINIRFSSENQMHMLIVKLEVIDVYGGRNPQIAIAEMIYTDHRQNQNYRWQVSDE